MHLNVSIHWFCIEINNWLLWIWSESNENLFLDYTIHRNNRVLSLENLCKFSLNFRKKVHIGKFEIVNSFSPVKIRVLVENFKVCWNFNIYESPYVITFYIN